MISSKTKNSDPEMKSYMAKLNERILSNLNAAREKAKQPRKPAKAK